VGTEGVVEVTPILVTKEDLFNYGACRTARVLFDEHYPFGSVEYQELIDALDRSNLRQANEYILWLTFAYENDNIWR
jgi:hypothetical protein